MAECCCPRAVSSCDYGGGTDCDASLRQIVRMVVHQNDPAEVLEALCRLLGGDDKNQPIAFFLMDDDRWTIAAKGDRKSTRLNSIHLVISYAVFCLKKKNTKNIKQNNFDRYEHRLVHVTITYIY